MFQSEIKFNKSSLSKKSEKNEKLNKSVDKPRDLPEDNYKDLVMDPEIFYLLDKNPEKNRPFFNRLDARLKELESCNELKIFKILQKQQENLKNKNEDSNFDKNIQDFSFQEISKIIDGGNYLPSEKLSDLPDNLLGLLLSPLPPGAKKTIYLDRYRKTLGEVLSVYDKWREKDSNVYCFHLSPHEIKGDVLVSKKNKKTGESGIYFSADIKNLFNLSNAKYIYAFKLDKRSLPSTRYDGSPDFFGRLEDSVEIEDRMKIFSEEDPAYRDKILEKLGGAIYKGHSSSQDKAAEFLKNYKDNSQLNY